jgi:coenzyme F420-reducing hydrogenase beta subunit
MIENNEGFLYPHINGSLCNSCDLCVRTCPINQVALKELEYGRTLDSRHGKAPVSQQDKTPDIQHGKASDSRYNETTDIGHRAYACFSKNEAVRAQSSSGGVFSQLAMKVLAQNGAVFGAGFGRFFKVRHKFIEKAEELDDLRRSKYVQSDTSAAFREARELLKSGRKVLFSGTPCQIAGLKAFLGREYENLTACEIACHGVPSPKVWQMFLGFLKKQYNSEIKTVSFRDKSTGWNSSSMRIGFENGSQYADLVNRETFLTGCWKSIFNRRSCFDCKFRIDNTKADITLADFWGIDRQDDADFKDNKGVSLVITHTDAGERAMERIARELCRKPRSLDEAVKYNPRLVSSVAEPAGRGKFFGDMGAGWDFGRLRRKYMDNFTWKYKAKKLVKRVLGRG